MTLRITDVEDNTTGWKLEFYQFLHIHLKHGIKMEKSTSKKNKKFTFTHFFSLLGLCLALVKAGNHMEGNSRIVIEAQTINGKKNNILFQ